MHTYELIKAGAKGDDSAVEQLILENNGLIFMVVKRFYGRGLDREDLYQLAVIGFLKAMQKFDTNLGVQFSTYAVPMMMGEIRRYFRDNGPIKVSRSQKTLATKAAAIRERLLSTTGREPSVSQIAAELLVDVAELSAALAASCAPESLEKPYGENELKLGNLIPAPDSEEKIVENISLRTILHALPPREKTIILLRYYKGETQAKVADFLGISQVQVSRLEKKILEKMRKEM